MKMDLEERERVYCTQETAGEVEPEMENEVVEERRGGNKEEEKSGAQV